MCGIVGYFSKSAITKLRANETKKAAKLIKHRGPDFQNIWVGENIALAHDKLSIQDFSKQSNQPLGDAKVVIAFNGEIYNWKELTREFNLVNCSFDGDVIFSLYNLFGIDFVELLEGDFAISIYDKSRNKLFLIRDRLGVKPLVYHSSPSGVCFASEAKAFNAFSDVFLQPNYEKIQGDLSMWFWNDKKETYFQGVHNVEAGTYLEIDKNEIKKICYWQPDSDIQSRIDLDRLRTLLNYSVKSRMSRHTKWSLLLSGGLDSSLVASIAASHHNSFNSYTVNYDDLSSNRDVEYANIVANKFPLIVEHLNHVRANDITVKMLTKLTVNMEEVVWDKVYYSMFKNYQRAHQDGYRVVINGQGVDEPWLGYLNDFPMYKFHKKSISVNYLFSSFINQNIYNQGYLAVAAQKVIKNNIKNTLIMDIKPYIKKSHHWLDVMGYWATKTYLVSNLMQEDHLSMANSVESRSPFLNYRIVQLALSVSSKLKVEGNIEKKPMKDIAIGIVPDEIIKRQKQAFINPEDHYDDLVMEYLADNLDLIQREYFFRKTFTDFFWDELLAGKVPRDLCWKIVAIYIFINQFNGDGSFGEQGY